MKAPVLLLFVVILITSCKKESNNNLAQTNTVKTDTAKKDTTKVIPPPVTTPIVLLSAIIDNITGDPGFGKPVAQFTYNGKQLSKALIYYYAPTSSVLEIDFNYDSNGFLTNTTTLSGGSSDITDFTYSGVDLSGFSSVASPGELGGFNYTITYQGGRLTGVQYSDVGRAGLFQSQDTYVYDSNGNNTKETSIGTVDNNPNPDPGVNYIYTNLNFDDKHNLSQTLPFWIYFRTDLKNPAFTFAPGVNNPVNANDSGTNFTYAYEYNSDGYPTKISWTDPTPVSYVYQYIKTN
jgi:hypothetical protein